MPDNRITVLHFTYSEVHAGAEEHMLTLLRGLNRKQFRPLLACHPRLYETVKNTLPPDVTAFTLRLEGPTSFRAAWQLGRILKKERVQILHSHMFHSSLLASPVGWACRVPVVVETPHVAERWRKGWLKGSYLVDRLIGRCVTYYIAVSQSNADYLLEVKGLHPSKVVVIRNGCDLSRFAPGRPKPAGLREQLGFAERDSVVLVPARLEPQKGHAVLLKALPSVVREFPQTRVVFVGDGALRNELEEQAHALNLTSIVRFVGFQSNMADWYAFADLMVLPSFFEGLPLVAIESLAAGCPVVATAVDGTPEVVVDNQTGLTVPPGDPGRLAEAIRYMFRYPEKRQSFGSRGRDFVCSVFNQAKQIDDTANLYRRAVSSSRQWVTPPLSGAASRGEPPQQTLAARQ